MVKVAIVTGGNKGIGYHIVRGLCKDFDGDVYLTARDAGRGQAAVQALEREELSPKFHQLDVTDEESIKTLVGFINNKYGGWDILVNNAGVQVRIDDPMTRGEEVDYVMPTNYFGCINMCKHFLPTIREGARMVHISSGRGSIMYEYCTDKLKSKIRSISTLDEITELVQTYMRTAKLGTHVELGWPDFDEDFGMSNRPWVYGVSKIGMNVHAAVLQAELDKQYKDVIINACSPGYCDTDMTHHEGPRSPAQGAAVALSLALLPPNTKVPRGSYKSGHGRVQQNWFD